MESERTLVYRQKLEHTFGKSLTGKFHNWEVANLENTIGKYIGKVSNANI